MTYNPLSLSSASFTYFGTGLDGSVTYAANTSLTSTLDGSPVIMNYTDLTINSGVTLTVSNRCRGLIIYCSGNCIINGTLSMDARGPNAAGQNTYFVRKSPSSITQNTDISSTETVINLLQAVSLATGGAGATLYNSLSGTAGTGGNTGGGGAGGGAAYAGYTSGAVGNGSNGTSFSGGSGGGGNSFASTGSNAASNAGAGGAGAYGADWADSQSSAGGGGGGSGGGSILVMYGGTLANSGTIRMNGGSGGASGSSTGSNNNQVGGGGGGAGNSGGAGAAGTSGTGGGSGSAGSSGNGGLIILVVKGNLTIGATGILTANGTNGGSGGSGGGNVIAGGAGGAGSSVLIQVGTT